VKLSNLFANLTDASLLPDADILSVTENSTTANPRSVFVCIQGAIHDGHRYAPDAYARGCRVFVAEQTLDLPEDACVIPVLDTRQTLATLACRLYGNPSHRMHLIGITGTKGKTTTARLLMHILNQHGIPCGYIGTNGISYANVQIPTKNTTPDAITLQEALSKMLAAGVSTAILEVSSQALLQHRADGTRFQTVLFTNLSPDHIGEHEHPDMESYLACKRRLFAEFGAESMIYNTDDPAATYMLDGTSASRRISCSTRGAKADFLANDVSLLRNEQALGVSFTVQSKRETLPCFVPLLGSANAENALLALVTAHEIFGISLQNAVKSLSLASVAGRSEWIPLPNGACVVIDYAHNAVSLRQLLSTLREYRPKRLIALFGSVGGRSQMRRRELGAVAAELCDLAILTSDNPGNESPDIIIEEIAEAFRGYDTPFLKIADRAEAIRKAVELTRAGDILVLAGKGHEAYQLIGDEKVPFCERGLVAEAINSSFISNKK